MHHSRPKTVSIHYEVEAPWLTGLLVACMRCLLSLHNKRHCVFQPLAAQPLTAVIRLVIFLGCAVSTFYSVMETDYSERDERPDFMTYIKYIN